MTGRKDIPRIFLTYAPEMSSNAEALNEWAIERQHLKDRVLAAPTLRISHILQDIDTQVHELKMVAEAMWQFGEGGKKIVRKNLKNTMAFGLISFLCLDLVTRELLGFPEVPLISSAMSGFITLERLVVPLIGFLAVLLISFAWLSKWQLPRYYKRCRVEVDKLVEINSEYQKSVWDRVRSNVLALLKKPTIKSLYQPYAANLNKLERYSKKYIQKYYEKIRT